MLCSSNYVPELNWWDYSRETRVVRDTKQEQKDGNSDSERGHIIKTALGLLDKYNRLITPYKFK